MTTSPSIPPGYFLSRRNLMKAGHKRQDPVGQCDHAPR
jgi:hypothetical protein